MCSVVLIPISRCYEYQALRKPFFDCERKRCLQTTALGTFLTLPLWLTVSELATILFLGGTLGLMVSQKRKLSVNEGGVSSSADQNDSDLDVDISSALTNKKPKTVAYDAADEDEDELQELIRDSIAKRDMKEGTELLKKTKGKSKIAKGEVGGGSFQSMGGSFFHYM